MKELNVQNATLMALVASWLIQIGAQLFAIAVMVRTYTQAPPRSFAMFEGPYGYSSGAFWDIVPAITSVLFMIAIAANWKNSRRRLLLAAFSLFVICAIVAGVFLEPAFAALIATGYRDLVDPALQERAAFWYRVDWAVWCVAVFSAALLLFALARPARLLVMGNSQDGT